MERLRKFAKENFNLSKTGEKFAKGNFNLSKTEEKYAASSFVTDFKEEKFSFTWRIENIHRCTLKEAEFIESPTFSTRFCGEIKWALRIYPRRGLFSVRHFALFNDDKRVEVGLFLHRISTNPVESSFRYRLSCERLLKDGSKEIYTYPNEDEAESHLPIEKLLRGSKEIYTYHNEDEAATETISTLADGLYGTNDLYCPHKCEGPETLVIRCDIYVTNVFNMGAPTNNSADLSKSCTLFQDLKVMYETGKFSDIILQAKGVKFPAHKNILASRSKIFDAMFQHNTRENQTGVIQVEDIEPAVLSTLLQYMYTGIVDDCNVQKALSLYSAADKYFLGELKNWCANSMLEKMTVENACQIAILAELHPEPKLKEATLNFFRHHTSDIFKRKEWQGLVGNTQYQSLVSEILRAVSTDFVTNCEHN